MPDFRNHWTAVLIAISAGWLFTADESCADESCADEFTQVTGFLQQHCLSCHAGEDPDGNLDLETLMTDLKDADLIQPWVFLYDRVAQGKMPPKSVESPEEVRDRNDIISRARVFLRCHVSYLQAELTDHQCRSLNLSAFRRGLTCQRLHWFVA